MEIFFLPQYTTFVETQRLLFGKAMKPSVLRLSLLVFVPLLLSLFYVALMPKKETSMKTYEVFEVKIEKNPSQSKLTDLGVSTWPM